MTEPTRIAFVCIQNAGRSQMAWALAQRELAVLGLDGGFDLVTGGTQPADHIHSVVVDAMDDVGIDISDRSPREVTGEGLRTSDYVVTMGCSTADVCPAGLGGGNRDWPLADPEGRPFEEVVEIRDQIERNVSALLDELTGHLD